MQQRRVATRSKEKNKDRFGASYKVVNTVDQLSSLPRFLQVAEALRPPGGLQSDPTVATILLAATY